MPLLRKEIATHLLSQESRKREVLRAQEIIREPEQHKTPELIEASAILAEAEKWNKNSEGCEDAYLECIALLQSLKQDALLGECYIDLGDALSYCKSHEKALKYYEKALGFTGVSRIDSLVHIYSQMAYCYAELGLWQKEQECLNAALEITKESLIKATLLERKAISHRNSGQLSKAASIYEDALSIFEAEKFKRGWENRVNNLVEIYVALENVEAAERTRKRL